MRVVGFSLFVLVWLGIVAWSAIFLFTRRMLPYHAEVMGGTEATLPPRVVLFYFAIIRLIGVLGLGFSSLSAYLLFAHIQFGDGTAAVVWFATCTPLLIAAAATAFYLHKSTGAKTPWQIVIVVIAVLILAYVMWLPAGAGMSAPDTKQETMQ